MTNATYTNPRHVATYVRSATPNWFGRAAVNCRVTRSGGRAAAVAGIVVTVSFRPRTAPARPRRSSSAFATYADASRRISFARCSSTFA